MAFIGAAVYADAREHRCRTTTRMNAKIILGGIAAAAAAGVALKKRGDEKAAAAWATKRKYLVQESWVFVAKNLEENGVAFFKRIFEIAPSALQMFSFRDEKNLYSSPMLKAHATTVMKTVGVAVAGLADLGALVPVLKSLGKKHVNYGVEPAHYEIVGTALLDTLKVGLGKKWTPEVAQAWTEIYGVVKTTMIAGASE